MKVLVTGGAGYIGSYMVHALLDAGERVVVLDNLATGFDWAVPHAALLVIGDTGNPQLVATLIAKHRVDAIIHFAGSVVVEDSVRDPLGCYRNNTVNSRGLIDRREGGRAPFHLLFDRRRLWQSRAGAGPGKTMPRCRPRLMVPRNS